MTEDTAKRKHSNSYNENVWIRLFAADGSSRKFEDNNMTVQEIINLILDSIGGGRHICPTCDVLACGDPDMEVTGIVTTFMPTVEVIRRTIECGANFIVSHEPTWFNGSDETEWCQNDSVYLAKKQLLEENHIAVWRFHDHMHFGTNIDYIYRGIIQELGWRAYLQDDEKEPWVYEIPATTLKDLAEWLKKTFEMDEIRTVGNPDCPITRAGLLVGGGSLGLGREVMPMEVMERNNLNVLICGDITEWTTVAYIRDASQLGMNRCMIHLGHERTEEPGMKYLPLYLKPYIHNIPISFISSEEPYTYF